LYNYLNEGKTIILDFFIVNCTSCQDGAPHLDAFWDNYGTDGTDQLQVISLEVSNSSDQLVSEIAEEWGIENPVVNLPETPAAYSSFITGYPSYIIICPDKSMSSLLDFSYPETILAWEQYINTCEFGSNFTDVNIFANEIVHCQKTVQANLVVGNTGTTTVTELTIDIFVDSIYHSTLFWDNILPPNTNTNNTPYPINFFSADVNGELIEFIVTIDEDINPINNRDSHNLNDGITAPNTEFTLQMKMDNYPSDLIWFLTNSTDDILIEGIGANYEAYEEVEITTLLDSNECYTFSIIDAYGDGMCCAFGEGYFNLFSGEDTLISGVNFDEQFIEAFYIGNEIGIEETYFKNKRITNKLYFNLVGQEISAPTQIGIYIQKTIFEDGTFESQKMMLTNTKP
jgi:thiol-disulfide isomerase/thioredoxin